MKIWLAAAIFATLSAGCAVRHPAYVTVPWAQFRSGEPSKLPLTAEDRDRLLAFFSHGGNNSARDMVPDPMATVHREALTVLMDAASLTAQTNRPARNFCEMAASLCAKTALFRNRPLVQQVVDAREPRPPFPAPLAVSDGYYWWIFRHSGGRLTEFTVVRTVDREVTR